jgi:formylglycine-generating enzyme required for sulfatase activity
LAAERPVPELVTEDGRRVALSDTSLGAGESRVYHGRDAEGRCYAVKVSLWPLPPGRWLDEERALLERIARIPALADRVVPVRGRGVWGDRPFFLMDWFPATLADWTATEPPLDARLRRAAELCDAVAALHAAGVVHRDLKPTNVLVDGDRLVLADFGAGRALAPDRTVTTRALHTAGFSAPEQRLPGTPPSFAMDVFALAATVRFVLTGRPDRSPIFLAGPLRAALARAASADPDARGSAADLASAVRSSRPRHLGPASVGAVAVLAVVAAAAALATPKLDYPSVHAPGGHLVRPPGSVEGAGETVEIDVRPLVAGASEVSQALWTSLMGTTLADHRTFDDGSAGSGCATWEGVPLIGDDLPMVCIDWTDAIRLANALSVRDGLDPAYSLGPEVTWDETRDGWRLPTTAEWQWLAHAGRFPWTDGPAARCATDNLADVATRARLPTLGGAFVPCFDGHVGPAPVASQDASRWGLHQVFGNVTEWTWDARDPDPAASPALRARPWRTARGGDWVDGAAAGTPDATGGYAADFRSPFYGARLVRDDR